MVVECLSVAASGPSCWTSTLALLTAACRPITPSSSRNPAGGAVTQSMTLTVDSGPSRCTSQASSRARAPVEWGPLGSRQQVSRGCFPMEPACPAVWTIHLHQGTRVRYPTPPPYLTFAFALELKYNFSLCFSCVKGWMGPVESWPVLCLSRMFCAQQGHSVPRQKQA